MARTSVYGFDRAQVDGYERIRAQVAFLAQQLGFSLADIEKLEAHEQNFQIVQITNAVASSDGTYTGQIVIDKGGSFEATQDCRVRAVSGTLLIGKTYLARQSGYDGSSAVFTVFDSTSASAYIWTSAKTTNYSAAVWEAVLCDLSSGSFTVTLPQYSACAENDRVLVAIIRNITANRTVSIAPFAGDKINGSTSNWVLTDSGTDYTTDGSAGGYWEFIRSSSSSLGWACSRFLNT